MKFITQAAKVLNEQKKYKRRLAVFLCLAVVVALGTAAALKMYGQAMSHKEKKLVCRFAPHQHTDGCYQGDELICGEADYAVHIHNDDCYGAADGVLACGLQEPEPHTHTEECWTEQEVLICKEEGQVHEHAEGCYTPERGELACQLEEHIHEEACYDENGEAACQLEEHQHDDSCWHWNQVLTCPLEGHQHTEECWTREMRELQCQTQEHAHEDGCYGEDNGLVCVLEEHEHNDDCYAWEDVLTCGLEENAGSHVHGEECYEMQKVPSCGMLELHTHDSSCLDENGALACGLLQLEEHVHGEDCFETVELTEAEVAALNGDGEETVSGDEAAEEETVSEDAAEEEETVSGDEAVDKDSVSGDKAEDEKTVSSDEAEKESHEHTDECYDAAGGLICGYETAEEPAITKTYQTETYIVTAAYSQDAAIPDNAELSAEMITAESSAEHYAQREAELKKTLKDENVKMDALFKIGFYADGQEIEPESDVMITVQFLDENGMAEGIPMTIVHFADGGSEILGGSHVKNRSTTFKTSRFSEFGIVSDYETPDSAEQAEELEEYTSVSGRINISESFQYQSEKYDITFHIKGKAEVPANITVSPDETDGESSSSNSTTEDWTGQPEADATDEENRETETETLEEDGEAETETFEEDGEAGEESSAGSLEEEKESSAEDEEEEETATDTESGDESSGGDQTDETLSKNESPSSNQTQENAGEQKVEFKVELLDEDTEAYAAVNEYAKRTDKGGRELLLDVLSYSVTYGGTELDVSGCEITAEVSPSRPLLEQAEKVQAKQEEEDGGEEKKDSKDDVSVIFTLMKVSADAEVSRVDEMEVDKNTLDEKRSYQMPAEEATFFAARASGQPNPKFTVQYYANLEKVAYNDNSLKVSIDGKNTNELPVIDTDGGKLPGNGNGPDNSPNGNKIRNLYVDTQTGKLKTKTELTKVYESRPFEYHKAPTINYMNALIENASYELKEVWSLKAGKSLDSTNKEDWDIYPYDEKLHFTNRRLSSEIEEDRTYIYISDQAVLRFVYDTTKKDKDFEAAFYDYDIGDGKIYAGLSEAQSGKGGKPTSTQGTGTFYMRTGQQGINSPANYTGSGTKLAFGNANTGSGLQHEQWSGNLLNKNNSTQGGHPSVAGSYKGCTFGLAARLINGKIQYASGITVPNLFNEGSAAGKSAYDQNEYSLRFNRTGDTHTLTAVNGANTSNLDSFNHPSPNDNTVHNHIWTNNFWPMDAASSFGTNGHDMKFGDYTRRNNNKFAGQAGSRGGSAAATGDFPWSDDGKDHNSYFGMHYKVEFDLDADYVGPLEYYFFGDDDMWVFLGDGDGNGKLVCDIGGVHSSVGEYLNLWDYIKKDEEKIHRHEDGEDGCYGNGVKNPPTCGYVDSKKFTLNFFYTERGESGSTCWMQFTLPSVSALTPEKTKEDYGELEIKKTVSQVNKDEETEVGNSNDEFTFKIYLTDENGKKLPDDYSYVKYDKDGKQIGFDLIIWDGGEFTLKNGEYIVIKYLPAGTKYQISENNAAVTVSGNNVLGPSKTDYVTDITTNGSTSENTVSTNGGIISGNTSSVSYNNKIYLYELPETGGPGILPVYIAVIVLISAASLLRYKQLRYRREGVNR